MSLTDADRSDHLVQARARARRVLGGEGHAASADNWRQSALAARNTLVLVVLIWVIGQAFGFPLDSRQWGRVLLAAGVGVSAFLGIAASLLTYAEVRHLDSELERERKEIEDHPDDEREEVRALYAAKGLREPLLSQVVDVLCADDDRLLKLMMEEELGLFVRPIHHPVLVGLVNAAVGSAACLLVALPLSLLHGRAAAVWVPASAAIVVTGLACWIARSNRQPAVPLVARWLGLGASSTGLAYFFSQWVAGVT